MQAEQVQAIRNWPPCRSLTELRAFFGHLWFKPEASVGGNIRIPELSDSSEPSWGRETCAECKYSWADSWARILGRESNTFGGGDSLTEQQQADPELGPLIQLRLQWEEKPIITELSTESEVTKLMLNQWEQVEVRAVLVYRHVEGKPGEQTFLPDFHADLSDINKNNFIVSVTKTSTFSPLFGAPLVQSADI